MTDNEITPVYREALCAHRIFLAAGVSAADIFVALNNRRFLVVAIEGEKRVTLDVGPLDDVEQNAFAAAWKQATMSYNAMPADWRDKLIDNTQIRDNAVNIIADLTVRGMGRAKRTEEVRP